MCPMPDAMKHSGDWSTIWKFLKRSDRPEDLNFIRELETGKMLGVLIATDGEGHDRTLYAFSGQLGNGGFHYDGFVGPVFDYLHPDGYFKRKEADISLQNVEISKYEEETVSVLQRDYEHQKKKGKQGNSEFRSQCRRSKAEKGCKAQGRRCR